MLYCMMRGIFRGSYTGGQNHVNQIASFSPPKVVLKRFVAIDSYYSHYYPVNGVPIGNDNEEPWDYTNRPKRRAAQMSKRLEKMVLEKDFYTLFGERTRQKLVNRPVFLVEPRNGMTVEKFLTTIGRGCEDYVDKFSCWDELFIWKSRELKKAGIPCKQRKWILRWVERYRHNQDPWYVPLRSKTRRNSYKRIEWRQKLITQKHIRQELGLDPE